MCSTGKKLSEITSDYAAFVTVVVVLALLVAFLLEIQSSMNARTHILYFSTTYTYIQVAIYHYYQD